MGLVAGGAVLTDLPLAVKLLVGLTVVAVGVLGPLGSVLLAGLPLGLAAGSPLRGVTASLDERLCEQPKQSVTG